MSSPPDSRCAIHFCPSPNHGERRGGVDCVILHYTGMPTSAIALQRLCEPGSQVSCHYFVEEDGSVLQLVAEDRRAWHAGVSSWCGHTDLNSRSIGVEIVNAGHDGGLPDFPPAQIEAVVVLCRDIAARRKIRPERILAHSDIAPGRKIDPGEKFPWGYLFEKGVGHWTPPAQAGGDCLTLGDRGPEVARLRGDLARYGYALEPGADYDIALATVVSAFQLHFRPALVDGVADASTRDSLQRLLATLPR